MLFNSLAFILFLAIIIILFYLLPHKFRWMALLIASYYFYISWNINLIVLIGATTIISYTTGLLIERTDNKKAKKAYMLVSVISSLSILFFFKYFNFFADSVVEFVRLFGVPASDFSLQILLPVGISFYTFQTLSYTIDVYRGDIKAEKHFGYYALFVSYFPQLVAGPIERPDNLLPQLKRPTKFDSNNMKIGMQYVLVGFIKKVVIADVLAVYVNAVYNDMDNANGLTVIIATMLFAVQILCDFDGYTNIAIGVAKMMNIDLMKNFNNPYSALSIKEFWSRWHISLSSWFRDYVYIPLGGNRVGKFRHLFNLFLTFILSGLWHGASWTFIIWGALHGIYQIFGQLTFKPKKKLYAKMKINTESSVWKMLKNIVTVILVCFAWIFFRANNVADAGTLFVKLFTDWSFTLSYITDSFDKMDMSAFMVIFIMLLIVLFTQLSKIFVDKKDKFAYEEPSRSIAVVRKVLYIILGFIVALSWIYVVSQLGYVNAFIYFQF